MVQVRKGVFETNSSSTHSITMCMKSEFDRWQTEDVWMQVRDLVDEDLPRILDDKEMRDLLRRHDIPVDDLSEDQIYNYARDYGYMKWDDPIPYGMEWFDDEFTTPSGETVVTFGWYGYDG